MTQTGATAEAFVVKPGRDIVISYVETFRRELLTLIDQGHLNLVIDLDGVSMIDSKGLAIFMLCYKSLSAKGGKLTVLTNDQDLRYLFKVMRMDEMFTVTESL
ncbi:MAG TPA: STAS domain-containing protein [Phycisphaerae bacterium]|nr:STAS domain-containing protein [Phycisphaerae bacterium]HRY68069.1 STAS domain-containing protein [Phycisphaerae bacterium]HSA30155.1 STAS domain-containing protein [Phycisphaerae bacterium]